MELHSADLRYSIRRSLRAKAAVVRIKSGTQTEDYYSKSVTVTSSKSAESAVSRPLMVRRRFEYVSGVIRKNVTKMQYYKNATAAKLGS